MPVPNGFEFGACALVCVNRENSCFGEISVLITTHGRDDLCNCNVFNLGPLFSILNNYNFEEFCHSEFNCVIQWKSTDVTEVYIASIFRTKE
jgi:hypothetical protein